MEIIKYLCEFFFGDIWHFIGLAVLLHIIFGVLMNIIRKSEMIDSIIYTDSLKEKLYDWLKSLKQRIGG